MFNVLTREREVAELDDLMRELGFVVCVQGTMATRPIQPAWYHGLLHGRPAAVTIVGRRLVGLDSGVGGGNRDVTVVVVSLILGAVGVRPLDYGISTQFGVLPEPDVHAITPPGHRAAGMPDSVRIAFHRFGRGHAHHGERGRSPHARYVRITNRSKIEDYLPRQVLPTADVLVMHELPMDSGWQARFTPHSDDLGWVAHALEVHAAANAGPVTSF